MDFYRISLAYNTFLQQYEKEKREVTKVPLPIPIEISLHLALLWKLMA
jgi:hypothetical protein